MKAPYVKKGKTNMNEKKRMMQLAEVKLNEGDYSKEYLSRGKKLYGSMVKAFGKKLGAALEKEIADMKKKFPGIEDEETHEGMYARITDGIVDSGAEFISYFEDSY
jgi:hypothetical protein